MEEAEIVDLSERMINLIKDILRKSEREAEIAQAESFLESIIDVCKQSNQSDSDDTIEILLERNPEVFFANLAQVMQCNISIWKEVTSIRFFLFLFIFQKKKMNRT